LKNTEKFRSYVKKCPQTNKTKHNSHQRLHRAILEGILIRSLKCQECGNECKTEAHHEDYSKPLEVIWLCRLCHDLKIEKIKVKY